MSSHAQSPSLVWLFATPWTVAHQAPLFMGFPRQEYWSGSPFPSSEDFPNPGIEPVSLALAGGFFTAEPPGKPLLLNIFHMKYYLILIYLDVRKIHICSSFIGYRVRVPKKVCYFT